MFHTKLVKNTKTSILCSIYFFFNNAIEKKNVEDHSSAGEATDDNMAHAHFTLGT